MESQPIIVGRVGSPWGLSGWVKVQTFSDSPNRFIVNSRFFTDYRTLIIEDLKTISKSIVIKFHDISDPEDAQTLRNQYLYINRDQLESLPEGIYYHFQILGIEVITLNGENLGEVIEILNTGSNDVYVVRKDSKEILIPGIKDVILNVDLIRNSMIVDLPEGLL